VAGLDADVKARVEESLKKLEEMGAILVEIDLNMTEAYVPTYYLIAPAEASSNLSRFDGVRYGYRCENPVDLMDLYKRSRSEGFGAEVLVCSVCGLLRCLLCESTKSTSFDSTRLPQSI
jgi:aspartyl-tRNA(Asn)/glutamyl-tRNA(Gln) amidotransferase subunit A